MRTLRTRGRRWWLVAFGAVLLATLAALLLRPMLEQAVRARIEAAALRHGMVARIAHVHVGVWPFVQLEGFNLNVGHGLQLHADAIAATWLGRLRLAIRAAIFTGLGSFTVRSSASAWDVAGIRSGDLLLTLVEPQAGMSIRKSATLSGSTWSVEARDLDVSRLFDVLRDTHPVIDGGEVSGRVDLQVSTEALRFHVDMGARDARLPALADDANDEPQLGDASDVTLRFDGTWWRAEGAAAIPELHATVAGADWSGSLALRDLDTDPAVDLAFGVRRLDFAQLLGSLGLAVPKSLGLPPDWDQGLGSATIDVQVRGRLSDASSLSVTQKIAFTPPRQMPPGILRLRGDFVFRPDGGAGPHRPVDVSRASPAFTALRDVPPLFVRTLLLAEDTGFYGHRGIDLRELPGALLTNWSRGGAARGASTITQQLAKNLFLSREKQIGRKLQELAITFLLESALGKDRILEIYLNIIEWGPQLRGLQPAACHYFGRQPVELTPAEMAFLVSIIPGPIKYQSSFARGTPGPGLRSLIDGLLAKLRSVDAIGEEDYRRALAEPIVVAAAGFSPSC
jgi:Transglycosylase